MAINKGFIKDWLGNRILPITRGELILDRDGNMAIASNLFLAGEQRDENGNLLRDSQGNLLPGLITAAERAMLTGGGSGGGISDIYTKLGYINSGIQVGGETLNFYTTTGTPINLVSVGDGAVTVSKGENNSISFNLTPITNSETSASQILKSITIDKFGRVTAVTGSALTNAEIPDELSGKTIKNSVLDGCTTAVTDIAENDNAVVNKAYVDTKFREVTGMATGALKFGGVISDATTAVNLLKDKTAWDNYFKITGEFDIDKSNLLDTSGLILTGDVLKTKIGDTVIIYSENKSASIAKFVYIPSADDITTLTVKCDADSENAITRKIGNVTLQFAQPFTAIGSGNTAYITLPQVSQTQSGYLSASDYNEFKGITGALKVEYTGEITSSTGAGVYKIGTLTIGPNTQEVYGKYHVSSLTLENGTGTDTSYNPILKFTETGETDVKLTLKGVQGISVKKNGNDVEFAVVNEVLPASNKYLTINSGYQFGVKIGSTTESGVIDGLTDYAEFIEFQKLVYAAALSTDVIATSLKDTTQDYHYGSTKLAAAVAITI